jgi:hypothetical protein
MWVLDYVMAVFVAVMVCLLDWGFWYLRGGQSGTSFRGFAATYFPSSHVGHRHYTEGLDRECECWGKAVAVWRAGVKTRE